MGAVLVHRTMSLDGFVAGPEHEMDWIFEHPAGEGWEEIMEATGAIIAASTSSWSMRSPRRASPRSATASALTRLTSAGR